MAIKGLMALLKEMIYKSHISKFQGKTAAIDAMSWLYRACYSCAMELH